MEHLSKDELRSILSIAKANRERDYLMILMGYSHGLRASEVVNLTASCIRDEYLTVQRLKGSKRTTQPLVESADPLFNERAAVLEYIGPMHPNQKLFPVGRTWFFKLFRKYATLAGIDAHRAHPHVLKHACAMHSIRSAGIENVRQYLGHKSLSSTGEYLKVTDAEASTAIQSALS